MEILERKIKFRHAQQMSLCGTLCYFQVKKILITVEGITLAEYY